jgi:hypothetical protein
MVLNTGGAMMRGLLAALLVATSMVALSGTALADPGGPNLQLRGTMVCDNGVSVEVNPGTATNRGSPVWLVDSTSVFIAAYAAVTDNETFTFVFWDRMDGVKDLTTCTRHVDDVTFIAKGYFAPRH